MIYGMYPLLDDGLITSIFYVYLCDDDVIIFFLVHVEVFKENLIFSIRPPNLQTNSQTYQMAS
jgi:hypothetical protein